MANLLNAIPQLSNKSASPVDKNPAKLDSKELKDLFQKKLSENLAAAAGSTDTDEKAIDPSTDLAAVALAAGAVANPKVAAVDLKSVKEAPVKTAEDKDLLKVAGKNIQIQNQLPVKGIVDTKSLDPKLTLTAAQAALIKNANLVKEQGSDQSVDAEIATMMAGQDLLALPKEHKFNVESVDVLPKEASSKLSTADFLNLREISQNPTKPNLMTAMQSPAITDPAKLVPLATTGALVMGMKATPKQKSDEKQNLAAAMNGLTPAHGDKQIFGKTMDATVSQVNGQKPVLTTETLTQISNQVNLLGQARQDGEIKIRLRPDHLGELQMSIRTQGQNVSVQIKAENNEAKKIIEDSLGALREHLSLQNLSLARIDVVTQPTTPSSLEHTQMQFDSNQNFNQSFTNEGGRNHSQDGSQNSRNELSRDESSFASVKPSMIRPRMADTTRLDLIA